MHSASDPLLLQMSQDFIAFLYSDSIDVINVLRVARLERCTNLIDPGERPIVFQRVFAPQEI